MKNPIKWKKINWKILIILCILVFSLGAIIGYQIFVADDDVVTSDDIQNYVEEYFSYYSYLYYEHDISFYQMNVTNVSNFTFRTSSYDVLAIVSKNHGAGIYFTPSEIEIPQLTVEIISYPIEYYHWKDMPKDVDDLTSVLLTKGFYPINEDLIADGIAIYIDADAIVRCQMIGPSLNIKKTGAVIIFGTYIEENSALLKGSNKKSDWSTIQADLDSLSEFLWDCKSVGVNDTLIETVEKKHKPSLLLEKIALHMKNGEYKNNQALFDSEFAELEELSNESMEPMLTKILEDFYSMQQESDSDIFQQIVDYVLTKADALFLGVLGSTISLLVHNWLTSRRKKTTHKKK